MSKEKIEVGDWVLLTGKMWATDYPDTPEYVQVREVNGFIYADQVDVVGEVGEFPGNGLFSGSPGEYDCEWVPASEVPDEIRFKGLYPPPEMNQPLSQEDLNKLRIKEVKDPVSPAHYSYPGGVQVIDLTRHMDFLLGNVVKYVARAGRKGNRLEDLQKAAQYLAWAIEDEGK